MRKDTIWVIATGAVLGVAALVLVYLGNPANMGFCMACFERDIAGALGFFAKGPQYLRPEIIGIALGALVAALVFREFKPSGGSQPALRFVLGMFMMIGALIFLGCPTRMVLRLGGGDLNAVTGLIGFLIGIAIGVFFLRSGFNLGRAHKQGALEGWVLPGFMVLLLVLAVFSPQFVEGGPIFAAAKGHPGVGDSPIGLGLGITISLAAGLVIGFLGQRSRLCFAGGFRDIMLMNSWHLVSGVIAVFAVVLVGNLIFGNFNPGFADQPIANTSHLWNIFGMILVGICATLLGGCPFRQLVMTGNGNTDSALVVFGMLAGAAFTHNFGLVKAATVYGKAAFFIGLVAVISVAWFNRGRK